MTEPLDKWQLLAAIANSPRVSKSWDYKARDVNIYYRDLVEVSRCNQLSLGANRAATFATTFLEQFMNLDADLEQQILQILHKAKDEFF